MEREKDPEKVKLWHRKKYVTNFTIQPSREQNVVVEVEIILKWKTKQIENTTVEQKKMVFPYSYTYLMDK